MRKISKNLGLYFVYLGVVTLLICYITGWTRYNIPMLMGLVLIIIGIIVHIFLQRRDSIYSKDLIISYLPKFILYLYN